MSNWIGEVREAADHAASPPKGEVVPGMSELTDFLLARIAEDEARASDFEYEIARALNGDYSNWEFHYGAPANWRAVERIGYTPSRVLAECAAKRVIIGTYSAVAANNNMEGSVQWHEERALLTSVEALAAVYADHPDYRQEWAA